MKTFKDILCEAVSSYLTEAKTFEKHMSGWQNIFGKKIKAQVGEDPHGHEYEAAMHEITHADPTFKIHKKVPHPELGSVVTNASLADKDDTVEGGSYHSWLAGHVANGRLHYTRPGNMKPYLGTFHELSRSPKGKAALEAQMPGGSLIQNHTPGTLSVHVTAAKNKIEKDEQESRNAKYAAQAHAESDISETPHWHVIQPKSHLAMRYFGHSGAPENTESSGNTPCVTLKNSHYYDKYMAHGGNFTILKPKDPSPKEAHDMHYVVWVPHSADGNYPEEVTNAHNNHKSLSEISRGRPLPQHIHDQVESSKEHSDERPGSPDEDGYYSDEQLHGMDTTEAIRHADSMNNHGFLHHVIENGDRYDVAEVVEHHGDNDFDHHEFNPEYRHSSLMHAAIGRSIHEDWALHHDMMRSADRHGTGFQKHNTALSIAEQGRPEDHHMLLSYYPPIHLMDGERGDREHQALVRKTIIDNAAPDTIKHIISGGPHIDDAGNPPHEHQHEPDQPTHSPYEMYHITKSPGFVPEEHLEPMLHELGKYAQKHGGTPKWTPRHDQIAKHLLGMKEDESGQLPLGL